MISTVIGLVLILGLVLSTNNNLSADFTIPLEIEEYFDYDCSHCRDIHPAIVEIKNRYGEDVVIDYVYYPVIPDRVNTSEYSSIEVAYAAEAARNQGKYDEYHNLAMDKIEEGSEIAGTFVAADSIDLEAIALELELDIDQFNADRTSVEVVNRIDQNVDRGRDLAVFGTPTVFIDGVLVDMSKYVIRDDNGQFDYTPFVDRVGEIINDIKSQ